VISLEIPMPDAARDKKIMKSEFSSNFNNTFLTKFFNRSLDTRRTDRGNLQHSFHDILLVTLVGVLCGLKEYSLIVRFAKNELEWFKNYGDFSNGIPSRETIRRFLVALDTAVFQECYSNWITTLCDVEEVGSIAIDGKTIRGASTKSDPNSITPHILTAWATDQGLSLAQFRVNDKSNEITAIPKLLKKVFVKGSVITIDAMGCQKAIVADIIDKEADYVIAVKGNQKSLETAIKETVVLEKPDDISIQEDLGHGRVEQRKCSVYSHTSHLQNKENWKGLHTFIEIETMVFCKSTQKITTEKRLYISSLKQSAEKFNQIIRQHWSIENQLHWVLDVTFGEDSSKKRMGNSAENFNIIFKSALTILKKEKSLNKSNPQKRFEALINKKYREKLLEF